MRSDLVPVDDVGDRGLERIDVEPPVSRNAIATLYADEDGVELVDEPHSLLRQGHGDLAVRRLGSAVAGRRRPSCASASAASPATVGASNTSRTPIRAPERAALIRATTWVAISELPPEVEEVVVHADPVTPSTSANTSATISSIGDRRRHGILRA